MELNEINSLLTLFLAIATMCMAYSTWKLANYTKSTLKLQTESYLVFRRLKFKFYVDEPLKEGEAPKTAHLKLGVVFDNTGATPIDYNVNQISATFNGSTIEDPKYNNMGGCVYPKDELVFWYGVIPNVDVSRIPASGVLEFNLTYKSSGSNKTEFQKTISRKLRYEVSSIDPVLDYDWVNLEASDQL